MNEFDYARALDDNIEKLNATLKLRNEIDVEIGKLKQFIFATVNMVSDQERARFMEKLRLMFESQEAKVSSLIEALRRILEASPKRSFSVTQLRDKLVDSGFDFSSYFSNPLASISTTLKRMQGKEVSVSTVDGVTAYRWIRRFPRKRKGPSVAMLTELYKTGKLSDMK